MDLYNFLSIFGNSEEHLELRLLSIFVYGSALMWLIFLEIVRSKIERSLHRGFFEFHLISLPLLTLGCISLKIQSMPNGPEMMQYLWPHFSLVGVLVVCCSLEWRLILRRK